MKRAIYNIFNNALSHNEAYSNLCIHSYLKDDNIVLEIGNNGEIIDKSIFEIIFEPICKN